MNFPKAGPFEHWAKEQKNFNIDNTRRSRDFIKRNSYEPIEVNSKINPVLFERDPLDRSRAVQYQFIDLDWDVDGFTYSLSHLFAAQMQTMAWICFHRRTSLQNGALLKQYILLNYKFQTWLQRLGYFSSTLVEC